MSTAPEPPEPRDEDIDARFEEIVGRLGSLASEPKADPLPVNPPPVQTGWRVHTPPEEKEGDHFVPPPPAPLPKDPWFWAALAGLVLGPVWLLVVLFTNPLGSRGQLWAAVLATITGFVLLIRRAPSHRDEDDDGSRV